MEEPSANTSSTKTGRLAINGQQEAAVETYQVIVSGIKWPWIMLCLWLINAMWVMCCINMHYNGHYNYVCFYYRVFASGTDGWMLKALALRIEDCGFFAEVPPEVLTNPEGFSQQALVDDSKTGTEFMICSPAGTPQQSEPFSAVPIFFSSCKRSSMVSIPPTRRIKLFWIYIFVLMTLKI